MTRTADFYNCFSFFYPVVDVFLKPQKRRLYSEINELPSGRLLEIGLGNGLHLPLYKTHQITGIDTSSAMLCIAAKRKPENVELLQMNGESLLFRDGTFDYVVLSHVIAVVDKPDKLLIEIHRVLKPDGRVFILNHFTPENWLRFVDKMFQPISRLFHFNSVFHIQSLPSIVNFNLIDEISFGSLSYFKLKIYGKA
ncbi:class I SAM-dependent methyltransferase [Daejeonella lutea]|uniref:Phosphatidylethanolamine/phosphatidyl-N-methylethanolamine N-methyltransferase n=1 Tax=Daejeonella lutea TaxID=572036 RepID=A0A1T5ET15_9SPHI|nr:class I SAM-dependent methyltransferase [Daejeonella lutea]SKB87076.1 phosphatidylethanolamine/phosphatidyl-N-methylethanolamine N-methyltransferase [Daejeonella lutea]